MPKQSRRKNKKPPKPIIGKQKEHRHPRRSRLLCEPGKLGVREALAMTLLSKTWFIEENCIFWKKNGWGRISRYYVYEEGGEELPNGFLWKPWLKLPRQSQRRKSKYRKQLYRKSDDFKQHFEMFVKISDELLKEKTCTPEDFEETNGWIRSLTFKYRDVYFIYCGGIKQANKIYLDVRTGEIFYR